MSGVHWWPTATVSSVVAGAGQTIPSGELRTKTLDCPLASFAFQTTCTPVASAATAGAVVNRENVSPVGQAKGPSPQSDEPFPLNWLESKSEIEATCAGAPNDAPPSVDFESQTSVPGLDADGYVRKARYTAPSGPTARSTKDAVPSDTGVTRIGLENVRPWSVERAKRTELVGAKPSYCDRRRRRCRRRLPRSGRPSG